MTEGSNNDEGKCCFVKAEKGRDAPFWMEHTHFDEKIKLMVKEEKAVNVKGARTNENQSESRGAIPVSYTHLTLPTRSYV